MTPRAEGCVTLHFPSVSAHKEPRAASTACKPSGPHARFFSQVADSSAIGVPKAREGSGYPQTLLRLRRPDRRAIGATRSVRTGPVRTFVSMMPWERYLRAKGTVPFLLTQKSGQSPARDLTAAGPCNAETRRPAASIRRRPRGIVPAAWHGRLATAASSSKASPDKQHTPSNACG